MKQPSISTRTPSRISMQEEQEPSLSVRVVSTNGVSFTGEAEKVILPSSDGQIEVLPKPASNNEVELVPLGTGKMQILEGGKNG